MPRHWVFLIGVLCFVAGIWASPWMYRLALDGADGGRGSDSGSAGPGLMRPAALAGDPLPPPAPLTDLYRRLKPSVVNIATVQVFRGRPRRSWNPFTGRPQVDVPEETRESRGSGLLLDAGGSVLTNHHVTDHAARVFVQLADGSQHPATVVGADEDTDIALLRIEGAAGLQPVVLGDSDRVQVGDQVFAIGNPFGLGHSLTTGIVSYKGRALGFRQGPDDFIQTDTAINPGNSGGPLFNMAGEVIGMNTLVQANGQGLAFSIPSNVIARIVEVLEKHGRFSRGYLGVTFGLTRPPGVPAGVPITDVLDDSPAARAGIRPGDVLLRLGGTAVNDADAAARALGLYAVGAPVEIELLRDGKGHVLIASLGDPEELASRPAVSEAVGIRLEPTPDDLQDSLARIGLGGGVVVTEVGRGGRAEGRLQAGDVILRVGDADATTPAAVAQMLDLPGRHAVTLLRGRTFIQQFV